MGGFSLPIIPIFSNSFVFSSMRLSFLLVLVAMMAFIAASAVSGEPLADDFSITLTPLPDIPDTRHFKLHLTNVLVALDDFVSLTFAQPILSAAEGAPTTNCSVDGVEIPTTLVEGKPTLTFAFAEQVVEAGKDLNIDCGLAFTLDFRAHLGVEIDATAALYNHPDTSVTVTMEPVDDKIDPGPAPGPFATSIEIALEKLEPAQKNVRSFTITVVDLIVSLTSTLSFLPANTASTLIRPISADTPDTFTCNIDGTEIPGSLNPYTSELILDFKENPSKEGVNLVIKCKGHVMDFSKNIDATIPISVGTPLFQDKMTTNVGPIKDDDGPGPDPEPVLTEWDYDFSALVRTPYQTVFTFHIKNLPPYKTEGDKFKLNMNFEGLTCINTPSKRDPTIETLHTMQIGAYGEHSEMENQSFKFTKGCSVVDRFLHFPVADLDDDGTELELNFVVATAGSKNDVKVSFSMTSEKTGNIFIPSKQTPVTFPIGPGFAQTVALNYGKLLKNKQNQGPTFSLKFDKITAPFDSTIMLYSNATYPMTHEAGYGFDLVNREAADRLCTIPEYKDVVVPTNWGFGGHAVEWQFDEVAPLMKAGDSFTLKCDKWFVVPAKAADSKAIQFTLAGLVQADGNSVSFVKDSYSTSKSGGGKLFFKVLLVFFLIVLVGVIVWGVRKYFGFGAKDAESTPMLNIQGSDNYSTDLDGV